MKLKKSGIFIIIFLLIAFLGLNSIFTVRENEYACTVRFSKIIDTTGEAGLHVKLPFVDSVKYFPKATQLYDIPPSEVLTSDKQNMTVDCYILWSISDPKLFYQTLGSTAVAEQRLDALTYNELKTVMGTLAQSDIINMEEGSKRNLIYEKIATDVDHTALAQASISHTSCNCLIASTVIEGSVLLCAELLVDSNAKRTEFTILLPGLEFRISYKATQQVQICKRHTKTSFPSGITRP